MANLNLSGSGHVSSDGSLYENVHISGAGKIDGDLRCMEIHASGSANVSGNVYCEGDAHCSGSGHFGGSLECKELHASGSCHISKYLRCTSAHLSGASKVCGNMECETARCSGATEVYGDVTFRELTMSGVSKIHGNASGENVRISGITEIGGLLNAENIEIFIDASVMRESQVRIKEIGCTNITVTPRTNGFNSIFDSLFGKKGTICRCALVCCEVIEGDEVNLFGTKAKIVRGRNVKIGEGCEIERVEYSGSIEIADGAVVNNQVKI